jgi:hypothetical protein
VKAMVCCGAMARIIIRFGNAECVTKLVYVVRVSQARNQYEAGNNQNLSTDFHWITQHYIPKKRSAIILFCNNI